MRPVRTVFGARQASGAVLLVRATLERVIRWALGATLVQPSGQARILNEDVLNRLQRAEAQLVEYQRRLLDFETNAEQERSLREALVCGPD